MLKMMLLNDLEKDELTYTAVSLELAKSAPALYSSCIDVRDLTVHFGIPQTLYIFTGVLSTQLFPPCLEFWASSACFIGEASGILRPAEGFY